MYSNRHVMLLQKPVGTSRGGAPSGTFTGSLLVLPSDADEDEDEDATTCSAAGGVTGT